MGSDLVKAKRLAGGVLGMTEKQSKGHKVRLSRGKRLVNLLTSIVDPRSYAHGLRLLNYYKALHVTPVSYTHLTLPTKA